MTERMQATKISENKKEATTSKRHKATRMPSIDSPIEQILFLQRTVGNQAIQRLIKSGTLQAKLRISQPNDIYEQEADRIAEQIMSQHESLTASQKKQQDISISPVSVQKVIQKQETSFPDDAEERLKDEKDLQRKGDESPADISGIEHRLNALAGTGLPLPEAVRTQMEESFGVSFDRVHIHTDDEAAQISRSLGAEAFTYDNNIYFAANRYDPATRNGVGLIAHELVHTLQQTGIQQKTIQRRGGAKVGELSICTNVVNTSFLAGHAWLSYTPIGGSKTTYGTWGNKTPIGLHRDEELAAFPAAERKTDIDAGDYSTLSSFVIANNAWGYMNNCASFAARAWNAVTGELLTYTNSLGIPNPSSLGAGIVAANGSTKGILPTTAPLTGPSSSGGSSAGSSVGSSGVSSAGSSGDSSGSSLGTL